jgi:hypothetical protein
MSSALRIHPVSRHLAAGVCVQVLDKFPKQPLV